MNITIDNPCHEDVKNMTSDEVGVFCPSCQKSVYDFTTKTKKQIERFFKRNAEEKICGTFKKNQLTELSVEEFLEKLQFYNPLKKFAIVLFFTFGFWLFGMSTLKAQNNERTSGSIVVHIEKPSFSVQFLVSKSDKKLSQKKLKEGNVILRKEGEIYKYTSGNYFNPKDAEKCKQELIKKGYKDAFIFAYFYGKKITYEEALKHLNS